MKDEFSCVDCAVNGCEYVGGSHPAFCPTEAFSQQDDGWLAQRLSEEENRRVIKAASASAHIAHDVPMSHLEETLVFAKALGAKKIGIASCVSLAAEARSAAKVFRAHGFEVYGTICKVGSVTYGDLGMHVPIRSDDTVVCNPMQQAKMLNDAHTDLNVVMGLCTGHDSLFLKYSEALCTLLTAKDFKFDHYSVRALRAGDESGELERLLKGGE